jgi:N-formylglutamate amidohydrolase
MFLRRQILTMPLLLSPALNAPALSAAPDRLVHAEAGTLPILLTAPHGGRDPVPGLPPRDQTGKPADSRDYVYTMDGETDELARRMAVEIKALTGKAPYLVVAHFHRKYIDANRPPAIAFDLPAARPYYDQYHGAIRRFIDEIRAKHPAGLILDVHGQIRFPDRLVRGTLNGKAVRHLIKRAGFDAVTGPKGLWGQFAAAGFAIFPGNEVPPTGTGENGGFNGGHTLAVYGSHAVGGIDAMQLEFGSQYRQRNGLDSTAKRAATAVAGFHRAYLQ